MTKIVVLASGSGSNAEAIIRYAQISHSYEVACVISDQENALVLERAKNLGVSSFLVAKNKSESQVEYQNRLAFQIKTYQPDWLVLAGFMRLLTPEFLAQFYSDKIKQNKIINIHPSLLPYFPGKAGYEQSFNAQMPEYGCSIHFVDQGMDTGKIIYQEKLKTIPGESFESYKARGLASENQIYPLILQKLFQEYKS